MSHGLPDPPPEPQVQTTLTGLAPRFKVAVEKLLVPDDDFDPIVSESGRTADRQAWLYGFGRTWDDGRGIVTHAATNLTEWHGFWLAVDIISKSRQWDAPPSFWQTLGAKAEALGLTWGGRWPGDEKDEPHVQAGPPMRQVPSPIATKLLLTGGLSAVWNAVGWA